MMDITKEHYDRLTDEIHTLRGVTSVLSIHLRHHAQNDLTPSIMTPQQMYDYMHEHQRLLNERLEASLQRERETPVQASVKKT